MKILSWNVNGFRAVMKKGFLDFLKKEDPDMLMLQETKAHPDQVSLFLPDYKMIWNSAEKKGYSGTVIFTKTEPIKTKFILANNGKKPVFVNNRFFINSKDSPKEQREIYLIVISPSGEKLPCKISGETGLPRTDNFVFLQPGEEAALKRERNRS